MCMQWSQDCLQFTPSTLSDLPTFLVGCLGTHLSGYAAPHHACSCLLPHWSHQTNEVSGWDFQNWRGGWARKRWKFNWPDESLQE